MLRKKSWMPNSKIFCVFLIALLWAGGVNYLAGPTIFSSWKQVGAIILWIFSFYLEKKSLYAFFVKLCSIATLFLVFYSVFFEGVNFIVAVYNCFLYGFWSVALIIGISGYYREIVCKIGWFSFYMVIFSATCMMLDLFFGTFDFLDARDVGSDFYSENGIAKRIVFFFVAKTMVIPIISFIGIIAIDYNDTYPRRLLMAVCFLLCAVATGSVLSMVAAILMGAAFLLSGISRFIYTLVFVVAILFFGVVSYSGFGDDSWYLQISRLENNLNSDSDANIERVMYYKRAGVEISNMSPIQSFLGYGLGATNDNLGNRAMYGHGESSLTQAYVEAGIFGGIMRIFPFLFIFSVIVSKFKIIFYDKEGITWFMSAFFTIMLSPTFGSITFQMVLGLVMARTIIIINKNK